MPRLTAALALLLLPGSPLAARAPKPTYAPALPASLGEGRTDGSIFAANVAYTPLVSGARAHGVGDLLTVVLAESTSTAKTANTKTQRTGSASITPPTAGPFALNPSALNASSTGSFNGQGNATQTNSFNGTITVTIAEVRSNGTALVRGEKQMFLAQGKEWIRFSGIVRLADVDAANQIQSGQVADAHIEYKGDGTISRSASEGWLSKLFSYISPF